MRGSRNSSRSWGTVGLAVAVVIDTAAAKDLGDLKRGQMQERKDAAWVAPFRFAFGALARATSPAFAKPAYMALHTSLRILELRSAVRTRPHERLPTIVRLEAQLSFLRPR
jgi:hypothetical protein